MDAPNQNELSLIIHVFLYAKYIKDKMYIKVEYIKQVNSFKHVMI